MSWSEGLILWLLGGMTVMCVWAFVMGRVSPRTDEHDWLADRKRKIERRGQNVRMGAER
jgi:hypothetical protein